ncbi:hypothetical protein GUJ93_ZPchr0003g16586 [Zizania palustris]|uniref:KNOX1 domain-containing protein n=1 Tax=Zizania palustris TaxID=103762 RepID=A0A8J5VDL0_ZIZPA|nr:hypothetical protein GUJ93_ZPchr0003g16586 [Zizania palustris]
MEQLHHLLASGSKQASTAIPFFLALDHTPNSPPVMPPPAPFALDDPRPPPKQSSHGSNGYEAIKAKIILHPLYPSLLRAFVDCRKIGAPLDVAGRLSSITDELSSDDRPDEGQPADPELDQFMVVINCRPETYCYMLARYGQELARPIQEADDFFRSMDAQIDSLSLGTYIYLNNHDIFPVQISRLQQFRVFAVQGREQGAGAQGTGGQAPAAPAASGRLRGRRGGGGEAGAAGRWRGGGGGGEVAGRRQGAPAAGSARAVHGEHRRRTEQGGSGKRTEEAGRQAAGRRRRRGAPAVGRAGGGERARGVAGSARAGAGTGMEGPAAGRRAGGREASAAGRRRRRGDAGGGDWGGGEENSPGLGFGRASNGLWPNSKIPKFLSGSMS